EIKMNAGIGALAPYNHANATIGRAYGLLSQNLQGGSVPGLTYMGSMGNNYAYNSLTFPENEERSPWEPFHVQHGFRPTDSTVSVFGGCRATAYTLGISERHWREHVRNMLRGMDPHIPPVFIIDPITAPQFIARGGFIKKDALIDWIYENARMPAAEFWDYQLVQNYLYPRATFGEEPWATKLKAAPDEMIQMYRREDIHVVVVGGETNGYWRIMGASDAKTVSVDDWRQTQAESRSRLDSRGHRYVPDRPSSGSSAPSSKMRRMTSRGSYVMTILGLRRSYSPGCRHPWFLYVMISKMPRVTTSRSVATPASPGCDGIPALYSYTA